METIILSAGLLALGASIALCGVRAAIGPSSFDRVVAFDTINLNVIGILLLVSIWLRTDAFIDVVLVLSLLSFLGTMSLAAFLEGSLGD